MLPSKRRCVRCGNALPPERREALDDQGVRRKQILGYGYAGNGFFCTQHCGFWAAVGVLERMPRDAHILQSMRRVVTDRVLVYYEDEGGCPRAYGTGFDLAMAEFIARLRLEQHCLRMPEEERDVVLRYRKVVKALRAASVVQKEKSDG